MMINFFFQFDRRRNYWHLSAGFTHSYTTLCSILRCNSLYFVAYIAWVSNAVRTAFRIYFYSFFFNFFFFVIIFVTDTQHFFCVGLFVYLCKTRFVSFLLFVQSHFIWYFVFFRQSLLKKVIIYMYLLRE